jgi:hypothetical protein
MPQMNVTDKGVLIVVGESQRGEQPQSVPPYTIGISDPSNTVIYDSNARTLTPNGTNNIGTVVVTATDNNTGLSTSENLNIVAGNEPVSLAVGFRPLP